MKISGLIPLLLLLGCSPKDAPPRSTLNANTSTPANTMSCTLKIWKGEKTIPNPTEADIRAAVTALDNSEIGPRLLLSLHGGAGQIELSGTPRDGFGLDYREGAVSEGGYIYASKRTDYSAETAIKVLVAYRNGAPDWKTMAEWDKLKM